MLPPQITTIILAAGKGKRMKSDLPKVMHKLAGKPLIDYVLDTALKSGAEKVIAVVGHGRELLKEHLTGRVEFALQAEQLGTGHAVMQTEPLLKDFDGEALILSGDVPLLRVETIRGLTSSHIKEGNYLTMITCRFDDPTGYGRIIRGDNNQVVGIVEHKDAAPDQLRVKEINSGIYLVKVKQMFESLKTLKNDNVQGEYYLTDIVADFVARGLRVGGYIIEDPLEIAGVNSVEQLKSLEAEFLKRNPDADSGV